MTLKESITAKIQALYEDWRPAQIATAREYLRAYEAGDETTEAGRAAYSWMSMLWVRIDDKGWVWPSFYAKDVAPKTVADLGIEGLRFRDESGDAFEIRHGHVLNGGASVMPVADFIAALGSSQAPAATIID